MLFIIKINQKNIQKILNKVYTLKLAWNQGWISINGMNYEMIKSY